MAWDYTLSRLYLMSTATLPVTVCLASASDVALGTSDGANNSKTASGIGTSVVGRSDGTVRAETLACGTFSNTTVLF